MKRFLKYDTEITKKENSPVDKSGVIKENIGGGSSVQSDWNQNNETQPDYIKNRPFYTGDPVETVMLPETTITITARNQNLISSSFPYSFEPGKTYVITFDGVDTEYTAYEAEGCVCVGYDYSSAAGGSGYVIMASNGAIVLATLDTSLNGSHTIAIKGYTQEIIKIDKKYLPDDLISEINTLSSDVSTLSSDVSTLSSDVSTKMDKANPTGTGSFSLNRKGGTTIGQYSFAEGYGTTASKYCSHTEGLSTKASSESQHVQGKYNIEDSSGVYTHIVGNGGSDSHRSNAHTLDWSGNAWFAGDVYVGSTSGTNKDNGSKKLAIAPKILSITLSASSWDSTALTQTVTATGVLSDEMAQFITPTPVLASQAEYYDAGILCTGQAANSLTFTADTAPTADITIYVKIEEVDAV